MEGYAKLSQLMGEFPDVAVFKRYSALNVRNILYLQARLEILETKLRKFTQEDETSNSTIRQLYSHDWYSLRQSIERDAEEGNDIKQWYTFLEIRDVLKDYNAAILQQHAISNLDDPTPFTISKLQDWMSHSNEGNTRLLGQDRDIWSDSKLSELLVLKTIHKEDPLSKWINNYLLEWYFKIFGKERPVSDLDRLLESSQVNASIFAKNSLKPQENSPHLANTVVKDIDKTYLVARLITTVLGCLLPVLSMALLHFMDTFAKRLGAIAGLITLFSFSLALLTSARVVDIFAATAAFAAVTVVFVGSDNLQRESKSN